METQLKEKRIVDLRSVPPLSAAPDSALAGGTAGMAEGPGEELGDEPAKSSAFLGVEETAERTGADGRLGRDA